MTNTEREQLAATELSKANLSEKLSTRRAFLLGYDLGKSHRYLLIQWINGNPVIDGCKSFRSEFKAHVHALSLPKINGVKYTVAKTEAQS